MTGNKKCEKPEHNIHICALKVADFDETNPKEFEELTADPKYKCTTCGAMVKNSKSVCTPVEL